jgi:hypothetical protein
MWRACGVTACGQICNFIAVLAFTFFMKMQEPVAALPAAVIGEIVKC